MENLSNLNFSGIYQILNLVNGKRYIGQAQNIQTRIHEHKRKRNKGYLYKAVNKYGWQNFEISVLEKVDDISKLDEREQFWLDLFQTYVVSNGYNVCKIAGTTRGRKHTEETVRKIKETIPDKSGENNPFFGKKHSAESLAKMSKNKIGKKYPKEVAEKRIASRIANGTLAGRKIIQFNLTTKETIKEWKSIAEASRNGFGYSGLHRCLNKQTQKHKGFGWYYATN